MTKWLVVAALLAVTPAHAEIDQQSANYILPYCVIGPTPPTATKNEIWWDGLCNGNILGVFHVLLVEGHMCSPRDVTFGQVARVVIKYMNDHPTRLKSRFLGLEHLCIEPQGQYRRA